MTVRPFASAFCPRFSATPLPPKSTTPVAANLSSSISSLHLNGAAGHVPGSINIGARPELSVWAGWLLDPEQSIYLVLHEDTELPGVLRLLWRTGFTYFGGYLAGGMAAWREAGREFAQIPQVSVHELKDAEGVTPLDVRKPDEWEGGHIPGARHAFLGKLHEELSDLDRAAPYCASGFHASIAASLLKKNGFDNVRNVPGSWKAWTAAGYETQKAR